MTKLKPCPLCRNDINQEKPTTEVYGEVKSYVIRCEKCHFAVSSGIMEVAIQFWNSYQTALKICPRCGGQPKYMHAPESWIECRQCHLRTKMYTMIEHAVKDWNGGLYD